MRSLSGIVRLGNFSSESPSCLPVGFILLVLSLSFPLWVISAVTDFKLLPGLPISALMAFCPAGAAAIVVARRHGKIAVFELLARAFDVTRIRNNIWYVPTFLIMPSVMFVAVALSPIANVPRQCTALPPLLTIAMCVGFFIGALGEELGWSGYAVDQLLQRWRAMTAAIVLGTVWALWHVIPWKQAGHSWEWVLWQFAGTVGLRVLLVWIYRNTGGSVFAVAVCHATVNVGAFLFPCNAVYDPRFVGPVTIAAATIVALFWGSRTLQNASCFKQRKRSAIVLAVLSGIGMLGVIALRVIRPVFNFPVPTGQHKIGTASFHWVDEARSELLSTSANARRELMVQIWYPAEEAPSATQAPYVLEPEALAQALGQLHRLPKWSFGHLKRVVTNAVPSAHVASDAGDYPVLIFLEGVTGFRQMNTFQVEALVSHGYIVAAIDQPYTAASVVFPDGRQAVGLSLEKVKPLIRQSYRPAQEAPVLNGRAFSEGIITYLAQDVTFTLRKLAELNQADPSGRLTGRLDLQRIGIFGVSLGGIVAAEACRIEARLKACLVMDAPMGRAVTNIGLQQPTMWITRDAETMQLEGWPQAEIHEHQSTMRAAFESPGSEGYFVQVRGMFHANLTDVPYWSPLLPLLGVTGPIDAKRAHHIVSEYSVAFFDVHLLGKSSSLLGGGSRRYPEVVFEKHLR